MQDLSFLNQSINKTIYKRKPQFYLSIQEMKNRKRPIDNIIFSKRTSDINFQQKTLKQNKPLKIHSQDSHKQIISEKIVRLPSVKNCKPINDQKYILNEIIGEGSFAKVRKAYRKADGLPCVIKSYEKFRMNSTQKKKSIVKEIQILKNITHPNIIKIIDSYETSETINIVMESFSNHSLATYVKQNSPIEEETLRNITKSIAEALIYLHQNKISHRDLKPENVLINSKNEIKVIDLGLAMMGDHDEMIVAGTPQFMCPELISKKKYNPYKADVWAFGILVYWMVLGYYPQDNCKKTKQLNKKTSFELKFPVDMHPGIQYLIEKMLETDPEQRIQTKSILQNSWITPRNIKFEIQKLVNNTKG